MGIVIIYTKFKIHQTRINKNYVHYLLNNILEYLTYLIIYLKLYDLLINNFYKHRMIFLKYLIIY